MKNIMLRRALCCADRYKVIAPLPAADDPVNRRHHLCLAEWLASDRLRPPSGVKDWNDLLRKHDKRNR